MILKDPEEPFLWKPGQFVIMDLPLGERRRHRWRSYSIANMPNAEHRVEFGIGHLDDGLASAYFFNQLKIGDVIKFKGPEGHFVLPENLDRPITMIATGTGVVPFVSMLRAIQDEGKAFKHIHLIYGCRYEQDVLYHEELKRMAADFEDFDLTVALSRDKDWSGIRGYVHQVYMEDDTEVSSDALYLICGWSQMIDQAVAHLISRVAAPAKQIKYELYG